MRKTIQNSPVVGAAGEEEGDVGGERTHDGRPPESPGLDVLVSERRVVPEHPQARHQLREERLMRRVGREEGRKRERENVREGEKKRERE